MKLEQLENKINNIIFHMDIILQTANDPFHEKNTTLQINM